MNAFSQRQLFIACIATIDLASSIAFPERADVVTDWNNAALDAIRAGNTAPPIASRSLAILHVSIYDAVNGIARTHERYLVQSAVPASCVAFGGCQCRGAPGARQFVSGECIQLRCASRRRFLLESLMAHARRAGIVWGEFVANRNARRRAPTMVRMLSCSHRAAAVPACGCRLLRRSFPICCRNGDSLCRLE